MDGHTKQVWIASLRTGTQQRIQYGNYIQHIMPNWLVHSPQKNEDLNETLTKFWEINKIPDECNDPEVTDVKETFSRHY